MGGEDVEWIFLGLWFDISWKVLEVILLIFLILVIYNNMKNIILEDKKLYWT